MIKLVLNYERVKITLQHLSVLKTRLLSRYVLDFGTNHDVDDFFHLCNSFFISVFGLSVLWKSFSRWSIINYLKEYLKK